MIFAHSLASDWNNGHAHFLRGVARELITAGHEVAVYEERGAWSAMNLYLDHGRDALQAYAEAYPMLPATRRLFEPYRFDVADAVRDADIVIVQEWSDPRLVRALGDLVRREGGPRLYLHDAHHRSVTAPHEIAQLDLRGFDGVLAFGDVVRDRYLEEGWAERAFTWHEAADVEVFRPRAAAGPLRDLVWIGNWGDGERTREYREFLLGPARRGRLTGTVYGVRYPEPARRAVRAAGLDDAGYLPNHRVPAAFARHRMTVHLPRRAYRERLPGIPTIRVFEALACGIPLVSLPWDDREGLFRQGTDHLIARDGGEMDEWLRALREDEELRRRLAANGLETVRRRHTCAHRVEELMTIDRRIEGGQYPVRGDTTKRVGAGGTAGDRDGPRIAFFGSSLVSSYWNGAATYYRGLLRALAAKGCRITFYEPDAFDRQRHRDMPDPGWARVVVYPADGTAGAERALADARGADLVVKASGVGVHDAFLEEAVLRLQGDDTRVVFWDVDAPATLKRVLGDPVDPFRERIPRYDLVCTYGGGPPVVAAYRELGAGDCVPVYNGVDPATHHPVAPEPRYGADLSFLGNRLPDREARVAEFLFAPARRRPRDRFLLGGSGWDADALPPNVRAVGHVPTAQHNAFNVSARAVLNVHRESMAQNGWSPATRVFEAAGAGACIITDAARGLEDFFAPDREILVAADGAAVAGLLADLEPERARVIGARARARVLRDHSYERRAEQVMRLLVPGAAKEVAV